MALGLRSDLLGSAKFPHAFFMRRGGASPAPWESLNFSTASGDEPARVAANLALAAEELGVASNRIYYLSQVHGIGVQLLDGREDHEAMRHVEGDITVSTSPGVACAVRMADCPAVLVADPASRAVVAIHSGWRGTVQGAAKSGVAALRTQVLHEGPLLAAIGPHIERCCFEVGEDVAADIAAATDLGAAVVHPQPDSPTKRPHVDLRRVIERQLRDVGVSEIDHVHGCTMCDPHRFHSYRRDGRRSGRMLAAVVAG